MTGKFGIGGNETLGGVNGLTFITQVSKMLLVDATLGLDIDDGETGWELAAHGLLNFADFDNSNLLFGIGINVMGAPGDIENPMAMSVDLPLRPVWFFNDHFSIFLETGLSINFMQSNDTPDYEHTVNIDLETQLLGSGGVHYWF